MTIREIEALSGMTRANIRFYESEGLLTPNRAENGYRDYAQSDLETLRKIRLLRALGLGIDEIRRLSAGETSLDAALEARLHAMQTEQQALRRAEEVARAMIQDGAAYATLDTGRYLAELESGAQKAVQQDVQPRLHAPWRRFFARAIDLSLYDMTWMVILTDAGLSAVAGNRGVSLLNTLLSLLTMLLLEPLLLHTTGTTPGKWLLGLSVRNVNGAKLRYSEAFARMAWLIWRGFGAGIPIYCWVRLYKSLPRSLRRRSFLRRASLVRSRPSACAIAARSPSRSSRPIITASQASSAEMRESSMRKETGRPAAKIRCSA